MMYLADAATTVASAANNPFTYVTGLGFPGVIIALFISGKLRTESEVNELNEDIDRLNEVVDAKDKQINELQASILEKAIPALTRSSQILEGMPVTESTTLREIQALHGEINSLAKQIDQKVPRDKRKWV